MTTYKWINTLLIITLVYKWKAKVDEVRAPSINLELKKSNKYKKFQSKCIFEFQFS